MRTNSQETADDISTTDAVDNIGFSNEESQLDQVQHDDIQIRNTTHLTQTDNGPPSYEEAVISSPQPAPPLYEEVEELAHRDEDAISESPILSAYPISDYFTYPSDLRTDLNDGIFLNEDTDTRIITSDVISEPDTSSILNLYLNDFAVELSDNYSTDTDWDSQSNYSVLPAEQISVAQFADSENDTPFMICSSNIQTLSSIEWDSESNSSIVSQVQTADNQGISDESNVVNTDSDSENNSSVLSQEQRAVHELINSARLTQTVLTQLDWDSESNCSVLSQRQISVRQTVQSGDDTHGIISACNYTENMLSESVPQNEQSENVSRNVQHGFTTQTELSSGDTQIMASVYDQQGMPLSPPNYDEAVPPPYYYDYIANVSRYK